MPVTTLIPAPPRRYVGGDKRIEIEAGSVQETVSALAAPNRDLCQHLLVSVIAGGRGK